MRQHSTVGGRCPLTKKNPNTGYGDVLINGKRMKFRICDKKKHRIELAHAFHGRKYTGIGRIPRARKTVRMDKLPDNPEVSARLTNLSVRHAGSRPAWFDLETLPLRGRTRQCKQLFWQIATDHEKGIKRLLALTAAEGMGKTSFLAELHTMLERAPNNNMLALAPGTPNKSKPFQAIRNILEHRLYISSEATLDFVKKFLGGAVSSIVPADETEAVTKDLMLLWQLRETDNYNQADYDKIFAALYRFLTSDLKINPVVVILDGAESYDDESLTMLGDLFQKLPEGPFTLLVTTASIETIPEGLLVKGLHYMELQALSDPDLTRLTKHLFSRLAATQDVQIPPDEICRMIAQRSYGSPQKAINLTLRHSHPMGFTHWTETAESLRHELPPGTLGKNIVQRFRQCSEQERLVLKAASQLEAPFSSATIRSILSTWPDSVPNILDVCDRILNRLRHQRFLVKQENMRGSSSAFYVFKHECERMIIAESVPSVQRHHIYGIAAQWYALNNPGRIYDEVIGDLWVRHGSSSEAVHYYVREAHRAYRKADFDKTWQLYRKLLGTLPEADRARRIQYNLDAAVAAFHLGQIDDAFLLCRKSSHYAIQLSSMAQAARASIQMASMLIEIGNVRHVERYLKRAQILLNRDGDPQTRYELYCAYARLALWIHRPQKASLWIQKARAMTAEFELSPVNALEIQIIEAMLHMAKNNPIMAIGALKIVIQNAEKQNAPLILANACHILGTFYQQTGDIAAALEFWNRSLGMAQDSSDVILHAKLLADIADGALDLKARRTARVASEQCLQLAQQTHQKALIARCMLHTAILHLESGQLEKTVRILRKAHKSAVALKSVAFWAHTLSTIARCLADKHDPQPQQADRVFKNLIRLLADHELLLYRADNLARYGHFLDQDRRHEQAVICYREAARIYLELGLEKSHDKMALLAR